MLARFVSFLQIRPGEQARVAFVAALFMLIQAAQGIGGNAADGLFFVRFGVEFLPYMFMALGVLTSLFTLIYSATLIRTPVGLYFTALFSLFTGLLLVERLALGLGLSAIYPILWLTINIINALLGVLIWFVAGEVLDTRQAKRLFPIFASAGILGGVVGNLATGLLAHTLGTENLLLLCALLMVGSWLVLRAILGRYWHEEVKHQVARGLLGDVTQGYDFVRRHRLLMLTVYASVLFSVLYFSISFPFSKAVAQAFPDAADLAGFLGLFSSVATIVTFVVSLLIANRLYKRIGIINAILLLPLVYLGGFVLWSARFVLQTAVLVRFSQLLILGGITSSAWWALFNVVPAERRGQVLGFDADVQSALGISLSGVLLLFGQRVLTNTQIMIMGMVVALVCAFLVWKMRRAYGDALVDALRAGRYEVFSPNVRTFARFQGNASALQTVEKALEDPKPSTRRIAAEIIARMSDPAAVPGLVRATEDQDAQVRLAAVRALGELDGDRAHQAVIARVSDSDPEVRAAALMVLPQLEPVANGEMLSWLEKMLMDPDVRVSAQASVALCKLGNPLAGLARLNELVSAVDPGTRIVALAAFKQVASSEGPVENPSGIIQATQDAVPGVRRAACLALGTTASPAAVQALICCLDDPDESVRQGATATLRQIPAAVHPLLTVLQEGTSRAQEGALAALPANRPEMFKPLFEYARREISAVQNRHSLRAAIPAAGRVTALLRDWLETQALSSEARLARAVGLVTHAEAMELVARVIRSRDAANRAEAIEALETLGDKRFAQAIVPLLDENPAHTPALTSAQAVAQLLTDGDAWTRGLAARSAAELELRELIPNLEIIAGRDPDSLPREAARFTLRELGKAVPMETLQTISSLERILLLRDVSLFAELSPDDLKQIADVVREQLYPEGAVLMEEGEEGNEMHVIVSGEVLVTRRVNGDEKPLARRGAGETIGEMAIIDSEPRSASIHAASQVRVLVLQADAFKAILRDRPEVSLAVMRVMSRRLREI